MSTQVYTTESALVSFFEQVAQKKPLQLRKLKQEQRFVVKSEHWCFTLPDLYFFLRYQDRTFRYTGYRQFRRLIFNSTINQVVKSYGAEITIIRNIGKVDESSYALVWR